MDGILEMNSDRIGSEIVQSINPQGIRMYLLSCGWRMDGQLPSFDIFVNSSGGKVMVPNDRRYSDYAYRVEDLVDDLASLSGVSAQSILAGMVLSASTESIEYRYEPDNHETGLIPVQDLTAILKAGNDINRSAYRDLQSSGMSPGRELLDSVRVGPSMPGSYVVQFVYPMNGTAPNGPDADAAAGSPNSHILCDRIESSITAVIEAAERGRTCLDPELGISHSFVSSILELDFANADVEVRRNRIPGDGAAVRRPITITRGVHRNVARIEEGMRPPSCSKERTLEGKLVEVHDHRSKVADKPVMMKLKYLDEDSRARTISFEIEGDHVDAAYEACRHRSTVSVTGTISGGPRSMRIENLSEFRILR